MPELKIDPNVKIIENATRDDVRPGDHLTWTQVTELYGLTNTERREGVAHHRDPSGDWRTDRSGRLTRGGGEGITLTIRRPAPALPTEDGAVIVPADGREFIEARVGDTTFIAREAIVCQSDFGPANVLEGAWRRADTGARVGGQMARHLITLGTCKVADQ